MKLTSLFLVLFVLTVSALFSQTRFSNKLPVIIDNSRTPINTYLYAGIGAGAPFLLLSLNIMAEIKEHYCITLGSDFLQEIDVGGGGDAFHTLNLTGGYGVNYKSLHGVLGGGIAVVFTEGVRPVISFRTDFIFTEHFGIGGEVKYLIGDGIGLGRSANFFGILNLVARF